MITEYDTGVKPKKKQGRIRSGWELTKSSWNVLKLDKELIALPFLGMVTTVVAVAVAAAVLVAGFVYSLNIDAIKTFFFTDTGDGVNYTANGKTGIVVVVGVWLLAMLATFVVNLFSGAVIYGATKRYRGGDPTVRDSFKHAWRRWRPLALFSMMMATVGLGLQLLEDRLPFAGKIGVWLVGAAWNLANVFALPVIVLSDKSVSPIKATKESVNVIKKVWGEGVVAQVSVGLIAFLAYVAYLTLAGGLVAAVYAATASVTTAVITGSVLFVGFLVIALLFAALGGIMKAALYHLAVTGESPHLFNKRLLENLMTPKKARKIFA